MVHNRRATDKHTFPFFLAADAVDIIPTFLWVRVWNVNVTVKAALAPCYHKAPDFSTAAADIMVH